jgi:outer membrane protein OmpA-like peptidoglycan-associated protein
MSVPSATARTTPPPRLLQALALAVALGACAKRDLPPPAELVQARELVLQAQRDPAVVAGAPFELRRAGDALRRAEALWADRKSSADLSAAAYVADREARAAITLASAKRKEAAMGEARTVARADAALPADVRRADAAAAADAPQRVAERERLLAAEQQAAAAQQAARAAQQQAAAQQAQLQQLQAQPTERGTLVTLGGVLFEFNRAKVRAQAQGPLLKLADFLKEHPERHVLIEGYTDNVGGDAYNRKLSAERAEAVANELVRLGVTPKRIEAVGHGEQHPVASNDSDTNRALNRRVEVYISKDGQPVRPRG